MELKSGKPQDNDEQIIATQLTEKDQQIQLLMEQVAEYQQREQALRAQLASLDMQLREITNSKIWRLGLILRHFRVKVAPIGSKRDGLLKMAWNALRVLRTQGLIVLVRKAWARMLGKASIGGGLDNNHVPSEEPAHHYSSIPGMDEELRRRARYIRASGLFGISRITLR
jgi:hypothetical protein